MSHEHSYESQSHLNSENFSQRKRRRNKSTEMIPFSTVFTTSFSEGEMHLIQIQVLIRKGLPRFDIIGLPQNMIREGKDRIASALQLLGVDLPQQKVLVSLNPGNIPKEGSHFDLPILVGILQALGLIAKSEEKEFYWGELGLDGGIQPFQEILASFALRAEI
jgi:magnesium chelatase family protein